MGNVKRNEPASFEEMEEQAEATPQTEENDVPQQEPAVEKNETTE
jgi:hypothetical protein